MKFRQKSIVAAAGLALAAGLSAGSPVAAQDTLTAVTFGGAFEAAAKKAWLEPFTQASGIKINTEQYDGGLAKLRAMVEAKNTTWDLIDLESNDAISGCDEGLLLKLDPKLFGDVDDFIAGADPALRRRLDGVVHRLCLRHDEIVARPHDYRGFLRHRKIPRSARLAQDTEGFARMGADGGWRSSRRGL